MDTNNPEIKYDTYIPELNNLCYYSGLARNKSSWCFMNYYSTISYVNGLRDNFRKYSDSDSNKIINKS